jgi:peptide/nickel transport system ATP-binding protein
MIAPVTVAAPATSTPSGAGSGTNDLLEVDGVSVEFRTRAGTVKVLDRIGFTLGRGETLGLVGESGSGKSVLSFALLGILDPAGKVTAGKALFRPRQGSEIELLRAGAREMRGIRGSRISMVFQNPRTALNPIRSIGNQIEDVLRAHAELSGKELRDRSVEMLARVRIPDPLRRHAAYPFELSGGMCQRVMIAMALACEPELLIADEPTTGLDVTTQASIMDLVMELSQDRGMATLLITHDLGLAAERCHRIAVMHAGQICETAPSRTLFRSARHPYSAKLVAATPRRDAGLEGLEPIAGGLPDLSADVLPACRFSGRCQRVLPECLSPALERLEPSPGHFISCRNPL